MRRALSVLLIAIVSIGGGLFVWYRLTKLSAENDPVAHSLYVAEPLYRVLPRTALASDPIGNGAFWFRDLLAQATIVGADSQTAEHTRLIDLPPPVQRHHQRTNLVVTEPMHEKLIRQASETLAARFLARSPEEYLAVRARFGAHADHALFDKRFPDSFDGTFEYLVGRSVKPGEGPAELIGLLFDRAQPHAIGNGGDSVALAYGYAVAGEIRCDLSPTPLGYAGWYGASSTQLEPFTPHRRDFRESVRSHGILPAAEIGCILFFADRPPRPLCLQFIWDPETSDWILAFVVQSNYPQKELDNGEIPIF